MFNNIKLNNQEKKLLKNFIKSNEIEEFTDVELIDMKCKCGNNKFEFDYLTDDKICLECGMVQNYTSANIGFVQYKQINKLKPSIYKPIAHMRLILEEMCCKRISVQDGMVEKIKIKLGNKKVNYQNVKKLLRKLGYTQHYLQMPCILHTLDPKRFPFLKLSSHEIRNIESMFKLFLQVYFSLSLKERDNRKNIINYHYVLKKICIKLKYEHVFQYLHPPDIKTTIKLEKIWNVIIKKEPKLS